MTEEFKRGLILGLSMQPLCVLTAPAPRPVIDISFNGNMINTGTDSAVSAAYKGDTPVYADGYGGVKCWSATTFTLVTISGCRKYLSGDFTIVFRFKLNDTGLAPFYGLRRMVWFNNTLGGLNYFNGTEIGFTGTVTTHAVTTNKINFGTNSVETSAHGTINRADGIWHAVIVRRSGVNVNMLVDDELATGTYPSTNMVFSDYIRLSGTNAIPIDAYGNITDSSKCDTEGFSLNGYIQGLKVFDKVLSDSEVALVI